MLAFLSMYLTDASVDVSNCSQTHIHKTDIKQSNVFIQLSLDYVLQYDIIAVYTHT